MMSSVGSGVYCKKSVDGFKIHELVQKIENGKIIYNCMWCGEVFNK